MCAHTNLVPTTQRGAELFILTMISPRNYLIMWAYYRLFLRYREKFLCKTADCVQVRDGIVLPLTGTAILEEPRMEEGAATPSLPSFDSKGVE